MNIRGAVRFKPGSAFIPILMLCLVISGCLGVGTVEPKKFDNPIEYRLILQMPYYPDGAGSYSQAALVALMTFYDQALTMEEVGLVYGRRTLKPSQMVAYARKAGLKAEIYNGEPQALVTAIRRNKPVIVRLGEGAAPLKSGNYVVVVGFTESGVVVNSADVHQQIVDWPDFLTAWLKTSNLAVMIEPF